MKRILVLVILAACGDGRLSPQGGTITGATTNGGLVVTSGRLGLTTACAEAEVLKWDDLNSMWECGTGGAGFSTSNVVPKGNGTTLVASGITDNGVDITLDSSSSITLSPAGYVDHDISLNLFGSTLGETYINGTTIGFGYGANTTASGCINCLGYQLNTTQFRDLTIADGKNVAIATFTGSTKTVDFNGDYTLFGSTDGATYIFNGALQFGWNVNAEATGLINYGSYAGGVGQFRNLTIGDGKGATVATFTASNKSLTVYGDSASNQSLSLVGLGANAGLNGVFGLTSFGGAGTIGVGTTSNHPLVLGTNSTERCRLSTAGTLDCTGLSVGGTSVVTTAAVSGTSGTYAKFTGANAVGNATATEPAAGTFMVGVNGPYLTDTTALNFDRATNLPAIGYINAAGYAGGTTQYRSLYVQDGRAANIATFTGSSKQVDFAGAVTVAGNAASTASLFVARGASTSQALLVTGSSESSYFMFGANEDVYIRGGKAASFVQVGDTTNTGGVLLGSATNPTSVMGELIAVRSTQLGNLYTADFVGINTAPDANHQLAFAQQSGNKIGLWNLDGTRAFGLGVQVPGNGQLQYYVPQSGDYHSFGYGDSDAFTETQRFDADGQVWIGATGNTAIANGLDAVTIGVGQSAAAVASGTINGLVIGAGTLEELSTGTHNIRYQYIDATPTRSNCESCVTTNIYGLKIEGDAAGVGGGGGATLYNIYSNVTTGAALRYSGYFATGLFQVNGASTFASTVNVQGAADFDSTINVDGTSALNGAISDLNSDVVISDGLNVTGAVDLDTTLNVDGNATLGDAVASDTTTFNSRLVITGTGTTSYFYFGANQDTYIRAGNVAGFVSIGDINSGGVTISAPSYTTSVLGLLTLGGNATFNGSANTFGNSATDLTTFSNGPAGINSYDGTHLEWSEEWMMHGANVALSNTTVSGIFTFKASGGIAIDSNASGRPGILSLSTSTSTTGTIGVFTNQEAVAFVVGTNWTWEDVRSFPTLSTLSEEYWFASGFIRNFGTTAQADGCWFAYDRGDVAANPATGDTGGISGDSWSIWCANNNTRTGYKLDGTASEDSFTTINSTVSAATFYRLKIVVEGTTRARFYINGTEVGRITTNLPTGARVFGAGFQILKSAGTTARTTLVDHTKLAVDLAAVRSP